MTLTDDEGHKQRLKVTKKRTISPISQTFTLTDIIPGTKVQCNKRHRITSLFDPDVRSRSHVKVKSHRCGGVCVL